MLTQNTIKKIKLLKTIKGRKKYKAFIVEGLRSVESFVHVSKIINHIYMTKEFKKTHKSIIKKIEKNHIENTIINKMILKEITDTKTPPGILSICSIREERTINLRANRWLYLYEITDPGNLGSLLRTAAWFNIKNIALSNNCTDPYSPKVIRSAMGAHSYLKIFRNVKYTFFLKANYICIGTDHNAGLTINDIDKTKNIVLFLGNEAHGINNSMKRKLHKIIRIPKIGYGESLNVSIAGSILMNELVQK